MLTPDPGDLPSLSPLEGEDAQGHGILLLRLGHKQNVLVGGLWTDQVDSQNLALWAASFRVSGRQRGLRGVGGGPANLGDVSVRAGIDTVFPQQLHAKQAWPPPNSV